MRKDAVEELETGKISFSLCRFVVHVFDVELRRRLRGQHVAIKYFSVFFASIPIPRFERLLKRADGHCCDEQNRASSVVAV